MGEGEALRAYSIFQQRRGLLDGTIRQRAYMLVAFASWLDPMPLLEATPERIEAWLDSRRLAPKSRYSALSTLHCFYLFALAEGFVADDPTRRILRPRLPRYVPRPMPDDDLTLALFHAQGRTQAWLALGAFQGLRCAEMTGLCREDVLETHSPPLLIVTKGKGNRGRVLPLNRTVERSLRMLGVRAGPYFTYLDGRPLTPTYLSQMLNGYLHSLGIEATAHTLRHWFATSVYGRTLNLRLTQELLGHSDPSTTAVYVAFSPLASAEAVRDLCVT